MLRAYKYRIYPTDEQKQKLARAFGCCRYVFNWALEVKEREYCKNRQNISLFDMQRRVVHELKPELEWLRKDISATALEFAVDDLYKGYVNFFEGRAKRPKRRKKHDRQHYHDRPTSENGVRADFERGLITIPKIKNIPCRFHRHFEGRVKQVAVELLPSGVYRVSVLVDDGKPLPAKAPVAPDKAIGIDMGLKHFAVLSDGQTYEPTHYAKLQRRKMKLLQRRLCKKQQGSRQYSMLKRRIARLHEHTANKRHDHIHKLTHYLAYENQATTICVEDLNVEGMMKNKHLAYNVADASIGEFYYQLEYKCQWAGKNLVKIPRFAPSSKRCSHCGHIYKGLTLKDREWTCPKCHIHHDRDLNAAENIKHFGLSEQQTLPSVRREVKPVEQSLTDDRPLDAAKHRLSASQTAGPKKSCCCDSTRRVWEDEQQPLLRNRKTSSSGRSRKSERPERPDATIPGMMVATT
jgi:putative transposase